MILRHAVAFPIKFDKINARERLANAEGLQTACDILNEWLDKKLLEQKKPIKNIQLLSGEHDIGAGLLIGITVELED